MCHMQCRKEGFQVPRHRVLKCYNLWQEERRECAISGKQWKILVSDKKSRSKLSAGLVGVRGFENKIWECYATKEMLETSLLEDAATALKSGKKLDERVTVERIGSAAGMRQSAPSGLQRYEERSGLKERTAGELLPWTRVKLQGVLP